jgi:hypothetical protein
MTTIMMLFISYFVIDVIACWVGFQLQAGELKLLTGKYNYRWQKAQALSMLSALSGISDITGFRYIKSAGALFNLPSCAQGNLWYHVETEGEMSAM